MTITTGQIIAKRLSLGRLDSFIEEKSILRVQPESWARPTWAVQIRPAAASYFNHCAPERNLPEFWLRNWTPTSHRVIRRVIRKCMYVEPSNPRMSSLSTVRLYCFQVWLTASVLVSATLLTSLTLYYNITLRRRVKQSSLCILPEQNTQTCPENPKYLITRTRLVPDLPDSIPTSLFLLLFLFVLIITKITPTSVELPLWLPQRSRSALAASW